MSENTSRWERFLWPVVIVIVVGLIGGGVIAISALLFDDQSRGWDAGREIGGAMVSGAIVGGVLFGLEELIERRREQRDIRLNNQLMSRDTQLAKESMRHSLITALTVKDDLQGIVLANHDLRKIVLSGRDLSGANLNDANLTEADLTDAHLSGADLTGANLSGANFTKANLTEADLTDAHLYGVDLSDANLDRVKGLDLSVAPFKSE